MQRSNMYRCDSSSLEDRAFTKRKKEKKKKNTQTKIIFFYLAGYCGMLPYTAS